MDTSNVTVFYQGNDGWPVRRIVADRHCIRDGQTVSFPKLMRLARESSALAEAQHAINVAAIKAGSQDLTLSRSVR